MSVADPAKFLYFVPAGPFANQADITITSTDPRPTHQPMTYVDSNDLDALQSEIARWEGAEVQVSTLTFSMRQLQIDIWRFGAMTALCLVCVGPKFFCGPLRWRGGALVVRRLTGERRVPDAEEFEVLDETNGVAIRCPSIAASAVLARHWEK